MNRRNEISVNRLGKMGKANALRKAGQKIMQWGTVAFAGHEVGQMYSQADTNKIVLSPEIKIQKDASEISFKDLMIMFIVLVVLIAFLMFIKELSRCVKVKLSVNEQQPQPAIPLRHINNP